MRLVEADRVHCLDIDSDDAAALLAGLLGEPTRQSVAFIGALEDLLERDDTSDGPEPLPLEVSTASAAAALGVGPRQVRRYCTQGRLRHRKLSGGALLIDVASLGDFLTADE